MVSPFVKLDAGRPCSTPLQPSKSHQTFQLWCDLEGCKVVEHGLPASDLKSMPFSCPTLAQSAAAKDSGSGFAQLAFPAHPVSAISHLRPASCCASMPCVKHPLYIMHA